MSALKKLFFGRPSPLPSRKFEITSISSFQMRLAGMRITEEYEMEKNEDGKIVISRYRFNYADGTAKRLLIGKGVFDEKAVADQLNSVDFSCWNGFDGPHPKGVTDGTMFAMEAVVNDGEKIEAKGSQNFPKGFHDLESWLSDNTSETEDAPKSPEEAA